ncbi:MAG: ABC transporter ATP-binding protein [Tissierellia bacterium]|nr:ABC transporter ATP-binding protein [Tissierellia bacterium]
MKGSIFKYGKKYQHNFFISLVFIFLSTMANLVAFIFGYRILKGLVAPTLVFETLLKDAFFVLISKLLQGILLNIGLRFSHLYAYNTLGEIRKGLVEKMANNPLGETLKFSSGYIRQKIVDSVEQLELIFAHMLPEGIPYTMNFIVTTIFIFIIDWRMGLLMMIPLTIGFVANYRMMVNGKELMGPYYESSKQMSGNMTEFIRGIEVVKIFNRKDHQYEKLKKSIEHYRTFTKNWYDISYTPMAVSFSVGATLTLAMIPVGAWMLMKGKIEIPIFLFTCMLAFSISSSLLKIMTFLSGSMNLQQRFSDIEADFLVKELEVGTESLSTVEKIEFKDVRFAYDEEEVIKGVNFRIQSGEQIAFVGESGSGKSTIIKLLMHYYDVSSGEITINGKNIKELSLETLMDHISYVFQDNFLFNISIRDNLLVGKPNATEEEMIEACKKAHIHDEIVHLEHGYDTFVGQSGAKLSGGQKQRICIARAMLKNADILILDEATSNTDPENEYKINRAVDALSKGKILISIAHKLSTIAHADRIYLLEDGKIIDSGNHEALLKDTLYKNLWERFSDAKDFEFKVEVQS